MTDIGIVVWVVLLAVVCRCVVPWSRPIYNPLVLRDPLSAILGHHPNPAPAVPPPQPPAPPVPPLAVGPALGSIPNAFVLPPAQGINPTPVIGTAATGTRPASQQQTPTGSSPQLPDFSRIITRSTSGRSA